MTSRTWYSRFVPPPPLTICIDLCVDQANSSSSQIPIGKWPKDPKMKEIGRYQQIQKIIAIDSYTPALFTRVLGWSKEEIDVLLAKVKNELKDSSYHMYLPVHFVYGRKP